MNKTVILLTACINPNGMSYTAIQDIAVRTRQYTEALDFYLQNSHLKIVFVENTLYDISSSYKQYIAENRLECLSFAGNTFSRELGKGYGEAEIIKYALEHSSFIKEADYIVKITGRLILRNLNNILGITNLLYAGRKNGVSVDVIDEHIAESRVIIASFDFYSTFFIPNMNQINDSSGYYFEHLLVSSIKNWISSGNIFIPIPVFPQLVGYSGSTGIEYKCDNILKNNLYTLKKSVINYFRYKYKR